jgi:hypothetical protein
MRVFGNTEYGMMWVTVTLSVILRIMLDIYVYDVPPYERDMFVDIWYGKFLYDRYWWGIMGVLTVYGYVWGRLCEGHLEVIQKRGWRERKKGSLCRRMLGF